jgi:hypothetical protein
VKKEKDEKKVKKNEIFMSKKVRIEEIERKSQEKDRIRREK